MDQQDCDLRKDLRNNLIYAIGQSITSFLIIAWMIHCAFDYITPDPERNKLNPIHSTKFAYWILMIVSVFSVHCAKQAWLLYRKYRHRQ